MCIQDYVSIISTIATTIATIVIAYYAFASHRLSIQMKKREHETSIDILTSALMSGKYGSQAYGAIEDFKALRELVKESVNKK